MIFAVSLIIALALTLVFPALVMVVGDSDVGAIIGGYFGLLLIGITFLALGLMTSTLTENQIVAFILGLLLCVFFWTATDSLIKLAFERPPSALLLLTFKNQFAAFAKGVVDLRNVVYFASVIAVAVVGSTYALKSRNWK